jgi:hypothetical protein
LPTSAHEFSGTLSVSGATTQTATFTETLENLPACSVLAKTGADGTWSIPQPDSNTFSLNWNISPYSGPGTFTNPSDFQDSVELDAAGQEFDPVASSTLLITVNADGSGSAKFSNLQNQYTQAAVNGTETWTCS